MADKLPAGHRVTAPTLVLTGARVSDLNHEVGPAYVPRSLIRIRLMSGITPRSGVSPTNRPM